MRNFCHVWAELWRKQNFGGNGNSDKSAVVSFLCLLFRHWINSHVSVLTSPKDFVQTVNSLIYSFIRLCIHSFKYFDDSSCKLLPDVTQETAKSYCKLRFRWEIFRRTNELMETLSLIPKSQKWTSQRCNFKPFSRAV